MGTKKLTIRRIPSETIVLGFTGPLGSGCTYFAKEIAEQNHYYYVSLTDPIKAEMLKLNLTPTAEIRQTIGNKLRKENKEPGYLLRIMVEKADEDSRWNIDPPELKGLVLDGIRNTGEVQYLRQFTNSFLFAIHADREKRMERLVEYHKVDSEAEFNDVDKRDGAERGDYGQQVEKCTYLADIIINNNPGKDIPRAAEDKKRDYVKDSSKRYVSLISTLIKGTITYEYPPRAHEACMTTAYCISKRSMCLKRKAGAVIATESGEILATGYNNVPEGQDPCVFDTRLQQCARDMVQQSAAAALHYCPACGIKLIETFVCGNCGKKLDRYYKTCPHCKREADIEFVCRNPVCGNRVFENYIPGGKPEFGKLLDICRSLHAEEMAIINLAKNLHGIPKGCVLYTTTYPCNLCANKIVEAGISKVVYAEPYPMPEAVAILKGIVKTERFEGVKSSAFFHLYR